jgi:hypothetical protein
MWDGLDRIPTNRENGRVDIGTRGSRTALLGRVLGRRNLSVPCEIVRPEPIATAKADLACIRTVDLPVAFFQAIFLVFVLEVSYNIYIAWSFSLDSPLLISDGVRLCGDVYLPIAPRAHAAEEHNDSDKRALCERQWIRHDEKITLRILRYCNKNPALREVGRATGEPHVPAPGR